MQPYVVRDGDHLARLAYTMGFDPDKVWNDPKNADLKGSRGDGSILLVGDVLYVPPKARQWLSVNVGAANTFVANPRCVPLSLALKQGGKGLANADCVVHGLQPPNTFTTDGDGKLTLSVPVTVRILTVEVAAIPLIVAFHVGGLDPTSAPSGLGQRLRNLGYVGPDGALDASDDDAVADALSRFQTAQGLPATGVLDDGTQSALEGAHGC